MDSKDSKISIVSEDVEETSQQRDETICLSKQFNQEEILKISAMFFIWFLLKCAHNSFQKMAIQQTLVGRQYLLATFGELDFFVGFPYVLFMWGSGSRKMPKLTKHDIIHLLPIALFHALARLSPLLVAGAGRVSSTTMVSTMAPLATALLAGRVIREKFPKFVYPILVMSPLLHVFIYFFGAELNVILMTLLSPFLGMVFLCLRNVFSKKLMNEHDVGENMCAENVYAVLSILSLFVMLPFILCFETESVGAAVSMAWENHGFYFVLNILIAGITSYLCNELLFKILGEISPVTLAVIMSNIFSVCKQALFVLMVETSVIWKSILSIAVLMASTIAYFFVKYRHRSTTPNVESSS